MGATPDPRNTVMFADQARDNGVDSENITYYTNTNCIRQRTSSQIETPYYYAKVEGPDPSTNALGQINADPDLTNCQTGDGKCIQPWALRIVSSDETYIAGAGMYACFYDEYSQACVDKQSCQRSMVSTYLSSNLWLYNMITIGATEMISPYGTDYLPALAADNTHPTGHPYWSRINAWLLIAISNGSPWPLIDDPEPPNLKDDSEDGNDDSGNEDQPQEPRSTSPTRTRSDNSTYQYRYKRRRRGR
ncbi:hypothetical protein KCU81_g6559, partial [Aureobasidium melanogenum]|uniref:Uncharacterized protein n=1 Tax=Aureobasidium melanogenum (strain CBS 110374) TaxID=1043003 RepID=A0A074W0D6_AURM1